MGRVSFEEIGESPPKAKRGSINEPANQVRLSERLLVPNINMWEAEPPSHTMGLASKQEQS